MSSIDRFVSACTKDWETARLASLSRGTKRSLSGLLSSQHARATAFAWLMLVLAHCLCVPVSLKGLLRRTRVNGAWFCLLGLCCHRATQHPQLRYMNVRGPSHDEAYTCSFDFWINRQITPERRETKLFLNALLRGHGQIFSHFIYLKMEKLKSNISILFASWVLAYWTFLFGLIDFLFRESSIEGE